MKRHAQLIAAVVGGIASAALAFGQPARVVGAADYDDSPAAWSYSYAYAAYGWGGRYETPIPEASLPNSYDERSAAGVGGSHALEARGDFTAVPLVGTTGPNGQLVDWTYGGLGLGSGLGGFNPANLLSAELRDYTFSFAGVVIAGLAPGQDWASGTCEVQLQAPDDTVFPADTDSEADTVVAVLFEVSLPPSAVTPLTFRLDEGAITKGSAALFRESLGSISQVNVNFNFGRMPAEFGSDPGNRIAVDALLLAYDPPPPPPPSIDEIVGEVNFDDLPAAYLYGYAYGAYDDVDVSDQLHAQVEVLPGTGVQGSRSLANHAGAFSAVQTVPPAAGNDAGLGVGCGVPFDKRTMASTNLADYQLFLDVMAAGLSTGTGETTCVVDLKLQAPDGTVESEPADGQPDILLHLEGEREGATSYRTLTFALHRMTPRGGSVERWRRYFDAFDTINVDLLFGEVPRDFECDDNNAIFLDNLKLVRRVIGLPGLIISHVNGQVELSWSGAAALQVSPALQAPFQTLGAAVSPYHVTATNKTAFYRLVQAETP